MVLIKKVKDISVRVQTIENNYMFDDFSMVCIKNNKMCNNLSGANAFSKNKYTTSHAFDETIMFFHEKCYFQNIYKCFSDSV